MNFLQFKYFIAIAEERSVSAAARKLYVSQQALSDHLKKMENEVGVPLFKRTNPLQLTVAGEQMYDGARKMMSIYDATMSGIHDVTQKRRSRISVAVSSYATPPYLVPLITQYTEKYPYYEVSVTERFHPDIEHDMLGADLYISHLPLKQSLESVIILKDDPYYVTFRPELAEKIYGKDWEEHRQKLIEEKRLEPVKELPFLLLRDRHHQLSTDLLAVFDEYNMTPTAGFASENGNLNLEMCLQGAGCFLSPGSFLFNSLDPVTNGLLAYPIEVRSFHPCLAVSYEKGKRLHTAELCFIKEMQEYF